MMLRFNRTFMELKQIKLVINPPTRQRFNRTFMELKQRYAKTAESVKPVLIGPSWN